jgi:hypothetical protein
LRWATESGSEGVDGVEALTALEGRGGVERQGLDAHEL